jgi:cytochrome c-type biogenesis protein CcmH/NrfG
MKTWSWIVLAVFLVIAGFVVWNSGLRPKKPAQVETTALNVSADSVAAFEQRVAELEASVDDLTVRLAKAGTAERREVKARLAEARDRISELKHAIDQWRVASGGDAPDAAYRQCVLLYGQARGACQVLAADTIIGQ